ncbi:MAG: hypothetical protein F4Y26_06405 [Gammaproteobacteria bacterium]|nr:hypothetical protein [Gammaproteobacteria bacterium]
MCLAEIQGPGGRPHAFERVVGDRRPVLDQVSRVRGRGDLSGDPDVVRLAGVRDDVEAVDRPASDGEGEDEPGVASTGEFEPGSPDAAGDPVGNLAQADSGRGFQLVDCVGQIGCRCRARRHPGRRGGGDDARARSGNLHVRQKGHAADAGVAGSVAHRKALKREQRGECRVPFRPLSDDPFLRQRDQVGSVGDEGEGIQGCDVERGKAELVLPDRAPASAVDVDVDKGVPRRAGVAQAELQATVGLRRGLRRPQPGHDLPGRAGPVGSSTFEHSRVQRSGGMGDDEESIDLRGGGSVLHLLGDSCTCGHPA